jgi:hypothetical protein
MYIVGARGSLSGSPQGFRFACLFSGTDLITLRRKNPFSRMKAKTVSLFGPKTVLHIASELLLRDSVALIYKRAHIA